MENDLTNLYLSIKQAVQDEEDTLFLELMEKRTAYIEQMDNATQKKEAILTCLEQDKEISAIIEEKKNGVQRFLLTQNNQLKAVKKYEGF